MAVFTGTFAGDLFTVAAGDNRYNALGGNDIAVFDFRLTDAVVSYAGNQVIVDTATSHTVLTGFQTYRFTDGTVEENDGAPLVADLFYYANNHDVWRAHVDADAHYASVGWREGRNPNAFFDTSYYLASNPDVAASGVNPLTHYDLFGWQEGRLPSLAFDQQSYLINNPGLAASGINPLAHFLRVGGEAGTGNPATLVSGAVNTAGFDATFYLLNNPDAAAAGVDPYQHFQTIGWKEGRNPNAFFDTKGYLATYTDVAAAHINPFDHYNAAGWHEGRNPSPGFDTTRYLDANPDVKAAGVNPLTHYLISGVNEGRAAIPQDIADASGTVDAIMEGAASGSNVGIKASWGNWSGVSFAITADTSGGAFVIDTSTGAVTVANAALLDYDHGAREHTITVQATAGALNHTQTFKITVSDNTADNQIGPVLIPTDANGAPNAIAENAAIGTTVGVTAFASDPDATDTVTYSLDNDAGGRFAIDANTGVVTVAGALDFETAASQAIVVRATSTDGSSVTQVFTIGVTNVNDTAPVAVNDTLGATEEQAGALAVNLLTNDTDLDGPAPAVTSFGLVTGGAGSASAPGTIVLANGAALSVDAAGHVTLTQNNAYDHLNAGETAQIVFNYQMTDGGTPAHTAGAQAVITVTGGNDQVDLDLNFGNAGDDRNAGLFDNVTPARLVFGAAATEITDAEDKLSSVSITITAPQGGSVNASEALGIAPDTLALVSSLLGFTVQVSGNGGQSLTISAPSGQFFTAQALETLLENVTYAINQSDFSFNASDRALSVTVTDFSTGATSDAALLTLDMRADVTAAAGQNAFTGGNLSDLARGGAGDDVIAGGAGDDALVGGADNDTLTGGSGNDAIIGNDATVVRSGATFNVGGISGAAPNAGESDTAVYSGASTAYVVTRDPSGSYTVADQVAGRDGTDTLWGIETIDFAGGPSLQLAAAIKVFDASGSVLLATYGADQLDQAVAFANGAGGANIIELDAAAGSFSAGAWPVVISDAVTIKAVNGGPATISAGANSAFVINESAVNLAGEVVRLEGLSISGIGAANTVGIEFKGTYGGSSDGAIEVIGTSVSNFGRVGLLVNGGGSGLAVSVGDDASTLDAETATFSGSGGANPLDNGTGDILFFEFTGDALLRNVAVTGNSTSADNGIQISGFQDGVGSANNVLTEIGNIRLENVSVNGTYQKTLVYIQGYNDLTALDFANVNLGALTGTAAGWAALFIDGAPQGGAYVANGAVGGSIDGTVDLTGVTVIGGVFGTTPNFVALGSKQIVVNGTLTDDSIVGTSAHEAFFGLAGNDVIATGGGNDLVLYNVGDGQDTVTDIGGFDTLGLINVDATLAPGATAASWTITNTGTTLSVDTDAAGTIDEVAATGFEALAVQLGDGGDTVTLDGNLGAGGAGLFAITVNGGLAGADGADIVDARTLSSATGIVFNGGAGSDRFVSSNAGGTDTFNGGADGVSGDTVDYSAVTGSGVTVNLSASGVNSTGAGNDTLINVENVIGTNQADTFTGSSDNNMLDGRGGAAVDQVNGYTGPGWQIRINAADHWVVQNASGDVDELIDIEKVVINGTTYLLVDQRADGGFASVQAAIDAASGGEVILIAPGSYVESKVPAPHSLSAGGLFIDKPNLILQGVKADGTPILTAGDARDLGATIVSGAQTDFGANHLVAASGATIQGLHLKAGAATDNKLLEIWADGFQVLNSFVDTTRAGDVATTAVTIYINEVAGTEIDSYRIEGNILNKGIYVANATGDAPGTIGTTQIIRSNTFTGDGSYDSSTDRFDAISVRGEEPGIGWQTQAAQVPLIEDNQVTDNAAPFLFRMREKDATLFPSAAEVAAIVDGNFSAGTTWAYVLDGSDPTKVRLALRDHDGPGGVDPFHQFAVANSISTHNLGLDPASDPVFGTLVVPSMQAGDIVRVNSGAGTSNQSLLVNDLTIKATSTSADLNLTLGGGVAEVTLADYAPGLGAHVDVTGNAAGNIVTGNSGANTINTLGGNDVVDAGGGADIVNAGEGDDIINYTAGDGADAVDGGEGAETVGDTLNVTGSGGDDYIRVSSTLDGDANLDTDLDLGTAEDPLSAIELDVVNVEEIVINTGAGNDTVLVSGDLAGAGVSQGTVRISGGAGDDTLTVSGTAPVRVAAVYADGPEGYQVSVAQDGTVTVRDLDDDGDVGTTGDGVHEGTDTLSGVEVIEFGGSVLDLTKAVRLFDGNNHLVATFDTLQAAVNAVDEANSTIRILGGTQLQEQVVIDGTLAPDAARFAGLSIVGMSAGVPTLDGSNSGVVIKAPADVVGTALDPWNAGAGTRAINAIVTVIGIADVSIANLTIDGDGKAATGNAMVGATATAVFDYVGIAYVNASGALDHVTVQEVRDGPLNGVQRGQAIYATNAAANDDKAFAVTNSLVTDFQKTGILVRNMDVTLTGNTVTGAGATTLIAQNGIQVGQDSTGDITGNTVSDMGYVGAANATSSGMYLLSSADLTVTGNSITGVGMGATNGGGSGSSVGIIVDGVDGSTITGNQLHDAFYGVWEFNGINPENNVDLNSYGDVAINHKLAPTGGLTNGFTPAGTDGIDIYAGAAGDDVLTGQGGDDTLSGGAGIDTALYSDTPVVVWDNGDNRWEITSADGNEFLSGAHRIEIIDGGGSVGGLRTWLVGGGSDVTIQALFDGLAANGEAAAGDTIMLASGTYAGNLTIDRAVTILGANQGKAGTDGSRQVESVIDGQWQINTGSKVVIDGVKFLDDAPVVFNAADAFVALRINVHGDHEVRNSVFSRETTGPDQTVFNSLGSTQTHRALELASVPDGEIVHIAGNLFTSDNHTYWYGGDNWRTGIYSNGGPGATTIEGNTFEYVRTAINADDFTDTVTISDNTFHAAGTGIAVGGAGGGLNVDVSSITTITDNTFDAVDTDFSFQNITAAGHSFDWSMVDSGNTTLLSTDALLVLGSANADVIDGTAGREILVGNGGADLINGQGGNDVLVGGLGDDRLTGGDGSDTLTGGAGADTFVFQSTAEAGTGFDTLEGFNAGLDKIEIDKAGFAALSGFAGNTLSADNFAFAQVDAGGTYSGDTSAPTFLLDNMSAGAPSLWYDDNGNGAGAVKIAEFDPTSDLSLLDHQDFWLV